MKEADLFGWGKVVNAIMKKTLFWSVFDSLVVRAA